MTNQTIVSEEYEPGVPGRACTACSSAWPASEPDDADWHHAHGCAVVSNHTVVSAAPTAHQHRCPGCARGVVVEGFCSRCEA